MKRHQKKALKSNGSNFKQERKARNKQNFNETLMIHTLYVEIKVGGNKIKDVQMLKEKR